MEKYVLFGAGFYAQIAIEHIKPENIEFIVDNDIKKDGTFLNGVPVYYYGNKKNELIDYKIIISTRLELYREIEAQLIDESGFVYITFQEFERDMIKRRIMESDANINIYKRAIKWVYEHSVSDGGIINNTGQPKSYPEVTGYFIPSLLYWGHRDLALRYAEWLCTIQKEDGSWYDMDDKEPFIFDTAQILKGLLVVRDIDSKYDKYILKGCDWLISRMEDDGRLPACNPNTWGDGKTMSELIHIYCLSPIKEAGELYRKQNYIEKAKRCLNYYVDKYSEMIIDFHLLSHFYSYVIEGLIDMGEMELARRAMDRIANVQKETGAVPAYKDCNWVCSTGLFQLAVIWFKLGDIKRGEKAFEYACKLQNFSGGWYGSYPSEDGTYEAPNYLQDAEISWAIKYFLDALKYYGIELFKVHSEFFIDNIDAHSSAYRTLSGELEKVNKVALDSKVLDIGSGKGKQLKLLHKDFPKMDFYAVDISPVMLSKVDISDSKKSVGSLTYLPYRDETFDAVYTCEALEHAIDIGMAIKEMARVTRKNGKIIIIDKFMDSKEKYYIEKWEQFFNEDELKYELLKYCNEVNVVHGIGHDGNTLTMSAWVGEKK